MQFVNQLCLRTLPIFEIRDFASLPRRQTSVEWSQSYLLHRGFQGRRFVRYVKYLKVLQQINKSSVFGKAFQQFNLANSSIRLHFFPFTHRRNLNIPLLLTDRDFTKSALSVDRRKVAHFANFFSLCVSLSPKVFSKFTQTNYLHVDTRLERTAR